MERNDRPAEPEEKKRLIEAGFVADNIQLGTTWSRGAVGASMTTEEALLLVDAEDKQRRMDRLVALCAGGARTVEHAEALLRQIEGAREPYSRCPKCGAVPLADTDDALFCEPCNRWYSRRPLPGAPDSDHEQPIADRAPSDGSGVDWTLMDDEEVLINAAVVCDAKALADGTAFPAKWGVVAARLRKMSDGLSTSSTKSAAPNWSDLTDREAQWIAREAGCDVRAVQLALQGRDGVRDDIRARVLEVAPRIRRTAPSPDSASFHIEARRIMRDVESVASESNDWRTLLERRFGDALRTMYQRGLSERPVPPAAIPLNAAQLRALAESDEAGDAPFVATASALREMVAAQLGWQVQMPVINAEGKRLPGEWTVMVPADGPEKVPGVVLLGIGAVDVVERALAARKAPGVLAVVEAPVLERGSVPGAMRTVNPEIILPVDAAGDRVIVAVFAPGSDVASAFALLRAWQAFRKHAEEDCPCQQPCVIFLDGEVGAWPAEACGTGRTLAFALRDALGLGGDSAKVPA